MSATQELTLRSAEVPVDEPRRPRRRRPDPTVAVVVLAILMFALGGIGSPLWGQSSLAETGLLARVSPYADGQLLGVERQTVDLGDTVDSAIPNAALFGDALRGGEWASWNPYALGGVSLGGTPNAGMASPVALPFWFLPAWLAPAYMLLLQIVVAVGGCYLFLRRIRLGAPAALLGGLAYATSAFMVVWVNWPQSRVAAFVPALFWALDRVVVDRRARDAVLVALTVAAMLLGGFPAVTGYALLTGAGYVVVRAFAEYGPSRRTLGVGLRALAGVGTGVALVAVQLLPWVSLMSTVLVRGREQTPDQHIPVQVLLTTIAPYVFGTVQPPEGPYWYETRIFLEEAVYVGAGVAVLLITAIAVFRTSRAALPRGTWWFFVGSTGAWATVIFLGGPPLALLQHLPYLFSDNAIERARSILGFGVAVLAAVGFQVLLDRSRAPAPGRDRRRLLRGAAVWTAVAVLGVVLYVSALRFALRHDDEAGLPVGGPHFGWLHRELAVGLVFVALALAAAHRLWFRPGHRTLRFGAAALIPLVVATQALLWVHNYWPRSPVENFYPVSDTHRYLEANLGHERFWGSNGAVLGGVHQMHRLRGLQGHAFVEKRFAELLEKLPGDQFSAPPKPATFLWPPMPADGTTPTSPILDRLAVAEFVTPPTRAPYGVRAEDRGDGSTYPLAAGAPVTVPVPGTGPVRGIGLTPVTGAVSATAERWVSVRLRDSRGRDVASARRRDRELAAGQPFWVPLAAEDVPAGERLTAQISVQGGAPLVVAGRSGAPALSTVAPAADGLRLVRDGDAIVYRRTTALPRARWASRAVVEADPVRRLDLLADGVPAADTVVLDAPGGAAEGQPASVRWDEDGFDEMRLTVDAGGAGYLVLADALQGTWRVTVDGRAADLVAADHGLVAVHVPAGTHGVDFRYAPAHAELGAWISASIMGLVVLTVGGEWFYQRRRQARPTDVRA